MSLLCTTNKKNRLYFATPLAIVLATHGTTQNITIGSRQTTKMQCNLITSS
jgi:hypothetical protein